VSAVARHRASCGLSTRFWKFLFQTEAKTEEEEEGGVFNDEADRS
jgi:hypothetical protein